MVPVAIREADRETTSLEEFRVGGANLLKQRLKLEPSSVGKTGESLGVLGHVVGYEFGSSRSLGKELCLARTFHGDEPVRGSFNRVADGKQPVVLVNGRFARSEFAGEFFPCRNFEDYGAALFGDHRVVLIEDA